ncbi:MAG TPA: HEAT repeat domain-containing protein [Trichocoleus sp.]
MYSSSDIFSPSQAESSLDDSLNSALAILLGGDFQSRWEVSKQLPAFGEEVVAPLLALLADGDLEWEVRWFAARILGHFNRSDVIEALVALLLKTEDEDLRQGAADALTRIGPGAVQALTQLLIQPSRRELAAWALAQIRHPSTVPPLLEMAQDAAAAVRSLAIEALAGYRDDRVLAVVQSALHDPDGTVRLKAVEALVGYRQQLGELALTKLLQPRLQDEDSRVARSAIAVLGRLSAAEAAAALTALLQTPETPKTQRLAVIQALGWMRTLPALQGLQCCWPQVGLTERLAIITALSHQTADLRAMAASTLLTWLQDLSASEAPEALAQLRQQGALALAELGATAALPLLRTWQSDPDEGVRLHAIAALRRLNPDDGSSPSNSSAKLQAPPES